MLDLLVREDSSDVGFLNFFGVVPHMWKHDGFEVHKPSVDSWNISRETLPGRIYTHVPYGVNGMFGVIHTQFPPAAEQKHLQQP